MRFAITYRPAQVAAVRDLTPTIREIEIAPEGGAAPFTPGAHINLSLPIGDGGADVRSYSLVGAPGPTWRIAVKRADDGRGGSRYMHALAPGARLTVSEPHNLFELDLRRPAYLLVAGGIGVTPLVGMAKALARGADVRMRYCVRSRDELAYESELAEALGDRLTRHVSGEGARLDAAEALRDLAPDGELYICGPLPLVDAFRRAWRDAGRPPHLFRTETFGSGGVHAPEPFRVLAPALGIDVVVPADRPMLAALEEAGVAMMWDCRRGECGLCAVDVIAAQGEIDHRDVYLSEHEKATNARMCACVSRVTGGGVVTIDTGFRPDHAHAV